jgi:hypothetical protein
MDENRFSKNAAQLILIHGDMAEEIAASQARKFARRGSAEGAETWDGIVKAICEQRQQTG